jgi:hypothetical protein
MPIPPNRTTNPEATPYSFTASVDDTSLPQGLGVSLLDGRDQPGRAVGDDQQRGGQAPVFEIGEEAVPGIGGLTGAGGQADEGGLAAGGDAPGG